MCVIWDIISGITIVAFFEMLPYRKLYDIHQSFRFES